MEMKGSNSSKVIMGATVAIVATVLALILLLLAELYCSILLRKRRHNHRHRASTATSNDEQPRHLQPDAPSLCSFYAQGVLRAPRSFLFPAPENQLDLEKQLHFPPIHHSYASPDSSASTTSAEQLIYICNPIYDEGESVVRILGNVDATPFETPETSPSRLESTPSGSPSPPTSTPPLTPMKKLPPEGPSISLGDARSICTTGSDSNYGSSSSSASPSTSPSW